MPSYTITAKGRGRSLEVQHVDLPGLTAAKVKAFRVGADLVERNSGLDDKWRVELTDNGRVLLSFSVHAQAAPKPSNIADHPVGRRLTSERGSPLPSRKRLAG